MVFEKGHKWAPKPGENRNPSGMPKAIISKRLRAYLRNNPRVVQEIVEALVRKCLEGDVAAMRLLFDRVEGLLKPEDNGALQMPAEVIVVSSDMAKRMQLEAGKVEDGTARN